MVTKKQLLSLKLIHRYRLRNQEMKQCLLRRMKVKFNITVKIIATKIMYVYREKKNVYHISAQLVIIFIFIFFNRKLNLIVDTSLITHVMRLFFFFGF